MKKLLTVILTISLFLISACGKKGAAVGMKNPMVEYKTTEDLYNACKFPFLNIDGMLNGFNLSKLFFIAEDVVEIDYTKDDAELTLRTAKGDKDISGLYYDETTETMQGFSDTKVIHKKKGDDILGAWWTNGESSFSISLKNGSETDFNTALNVAFFMSESLGIYTQDQTFENESTEAP